MTEELEQRVAERVRRRDGAFRWGVYRDLEQPDVYVETFLVTSWAEHLRQHERLTRSDAELEQRIRSHIRADALVRHLMHAAPEERIVDPTSLHGLSRTAGPAEQLRKSSSAASHLLKRCLTPADSVAIGGAMLLLAAAAQLAGYIPAARQVREDSTHGDPEKSSTSMSFIEARQLRRALLRRDP